MKKEGYCHLISEEAKALIQGKSRVWQEYPRPQMKRDSFYSLNGIWKCNGKDILIPFCPQAYLSGYGETKEEVFLYETSFHLSENWNKGRTLLHFGAVDQKALVWLNGEFLGEHLGGYLPFSFDITKIVHGGENFLKVEAVDCLSLTYPYGKQSKKRGGMWYTPVSGIWQTVWLESVPETYIERIKITSGLTGIELEVFDNKKEEPGFMVEIFLPNGESLKKSFQGGYAKIDLQNLLEEEEKGILPILWSPDHPFLYTMRIYMKEDEVESYFALRTIEIKEIEEKNRVLLNGKPIFLHGILDQGYFCDGIFLPALEEGYLDDIIKMKELGFNLLRKHIKIEPEAFYYFCDKIGMLVMQDMVNSGSYHFIKDTALPTIGLKRRRDYGKPVPKERKEFFIRHTKETIEHLYNHPSIVAYTIFNEGWGQFESDYIYDKVKQWDPYRLIDSTSGWFWQKKNDFDSEHIYFKVKELHPGKRPLLVSECGGYAMKVENHVYNEEKSYGYGKAETKEELTKQILFMYEKMILPFIKMGVCGCIYTQLSDVEDEINGLYTYDRKICKVMKKEMKELAVRLQEELE